MKKMLTVSAVCLLLIVGAAFFVSSVRENRNAEADFYVGVTFCGDTAAEAKLLVDRVKDYTNLFVLQSGPVSENETATNEICDYVVGAGLDVIVYFGDLDPATLRRHEEVYDKEVVWRVSWLTTAKQRWGDSFLGVYYYDEPGGNWLDYPEWDAIVGSTSETAYDRAAEVYTGFFVREGGYKELRANNLTIFTSDYLLYWFDYLMDYDIVFAQLGWNHTIAQDIALIRGAANLQNKTWGTMLTWKYDNPPYLDIPENIYNQLEASYKAGADYIIIFNYPTYPEGNQYGAMTDDHFEALKTFWTNIVTNPDVVHGSTEAEAVLVLPRNYGWGMRNPDDKIWAFWGPDDNSEQIWNISRQLLAQYGKSIDIVYDDPAFPVTDKYTKIYYWNQTITQNP
jgi:hypothetical protein